MYKKFGMVLVCFFVIQCTQAKKHIPVEHFNHLPMIQQPSISPDGKNIAVILNQNEETQVAIVPINNLNDFNIIIKLGIEKYRVENVDWANNERLIVSVTRPYTINTNKTRMPHLYSVGLDGNSIELVSPAARRADSEWKKLIASTTLQSLLYKEPNHILVETSDTRDNNNSSIFKVDINTGKFKKYLPNTKKISRWGLNKDGHILFGVGGTGNNNNERYVYVRDSEDSKWEKVKSFEDFKTEQFSPIIYDNKNHILYVFSDHKLNKLAIWSYDTKKKEYIEVIGQAPGNLDVSSVSTSYKDGEYKLISYTYSDDDERIVYFDKNNNSISRQIHDLFLKQGLNANVVDYDSKRENYLISVERDNKPKRYLLFNTKAMKFTPWFSEYPHLVKQELAEVEPITFNARDGMELHGYYTVAKGIKNPPLVLFPHGGPASRDYKVFDPFVQLFASRGFAVLQVNFRGSDGYGLAYRNAGFNQWGAKMQTDLIDGLNWVKENRKADTNNACIVGASYGGYSALVAGFQTPDQFKCIVSIAGISDLDKQVSHWRVRGGEEYVFNAVNDNGNIDIKNISPVHNIDKFKAPVLLIHGQADTRVDFVQSEIMHKALKKAGKDSKFVTFKFGTHNLNDAANRKVAMEELDKFLKKHLD